MTMAPDWPAMATAPCSMVTMRSSILVKSFSPALRLPRQFGPVTARPVSRIAACNSAASLWLSSSCSSLKPEVTMVAERAPAAAASRITCTAKRAGTSTST